MFSEEGRTAGAAPPRRSSAASNTHTLNDGTVCVPQCFCVCVSECVLETRGGRQLNIKLVCDSGSARRKLPARGKHPNSSELSLSAAAAESRVPEAQIADQIADHTLALVSRLRSLNFAVQQVQTS